MYIVFMFCSYCKINMFTISKGLPTISKGLLMIMTINIVMCTIYTVIPDNGCSPDGIPHHGDCHNLQYYLSNKDKYFTNNVQMYLLHGVHYLHTNLSVQNCYNISLIGIGGSVDMHCIKLSLRIILVNNIKLTIKNITIKNCGINISPGVTVLPYQYGIHTWITV